MGIVIPEVEGTPDRTLKQRLTWICDDCRDRKTGNLLKFESDYPVCPSCGKSGAPTVRLMTLIHLLVPSPTGPIGGRAGRYYIACDPKRAHQATGTNREACTNHTGVANCEGCRNWMRKNNVSLITDQILTPRDSMEG